MCCVLCHKFGFMEMLLKFSILEHSLAYYNFTCLPPKWVLLSKSSVPVHVKPLKPLFFCDSRLNISVFPCLLDQLAKEHSSKPARKKAQHLSPPLIHEEHNQLPSPPSSNAWLQNLPDVFSAKKKPLCLIDLFICKAADQLEGIIKKMEINPKTNTFKKLFPEKFLGFIQASTNYRFFEIFWQAQQAGPVQKFVRFGKTPQGTWSALKEGK